MGGPTSWSNDIRLPLGRNVKHFRPWFRLIAGISYNSLPKVESHHFSAGWVYSTPYPLNLGRVVHQVAGRPCEVLHHFSFGGRGQTPTD